MTVLSGCDVDSVLETWDILDDNQFGVASDALEDNPIVGLTTNDFDYIINDFNIKEVEEAESIVLPQLDLTAKVVVNELPETDGTLTEVESAILDNSNNTKIVLMANNTDNGYNGFDVSEDVYLTTLTLETFTDPVTKTYYPELISHNDDSDKIMRETSNYIPNMLDNLWELYSTRATVEDNYDKNVIEQIDGFLEAGILIFNDAGSEKVAVGNSVLNEHNIIRAMLPVMKDQLYKDGYNISEVEFSAKSKSYRTLLKEVDSSTAVIVILDIEPHDPKNIDNNGTKIYSGTGTNLEINSMKKLLNDIVGITGIEASLTDKVDSLGGQGDGIYTLDKYISKNTIVPVIKISLGSSTEDNMEKLNNADIQSKLTEVILNNIKSMYASN